GKLTAKLNELRAKIEGTPIKTVVTTSVTLGGPAGAGMALDFTQTTTITDIKEIDVDEKLLELPAGFTKKVGGYISITKSDADDADRADLPNAGWEICAICVICVA